MFRQKPIDWIFALLFLVLTIVFGNYTEQSEFSIGLYFLWFALYVWIVFKQANEGNLVFFLLVAALARVSLISIFPMLSDDIYRFIWDGRLILNGENPFNHLPTTIIEEAQNYSGLNRQLFSALNSPNYYTIYPPVCQGIFAVVESIAQSSIAQSAAIMKSIMILFEIGTFYLLYHILKHLNIPTKAALIYALNPLIIIEISGNLHFEGAMVFFLSGAIFMLMKKKWIASAAFLSLSIASKLLPLMFLPILLSYLGWKKGLRYCAVVGLLTILLFLPLFNLTFLENFSNSLDLYFQKFEFNASIYYIGREIGQFLTGYNIIGTLGPSLAIITIVSILILAFRRKIDSYHNLLTGMLFSFGVYLALGTTIHPWYLSIPIFLSCFTEYKFIIAWTALIMLSYLSYTATEFQERPFLVVLQYVIVYAIFFWEVLYKRKVSNLTLG